MQSTGQAGMHSSQPVHWAATVCMALGAPTMQSTGQALMHSVQPMHQSSSITASRSGPPRRGGLSARTGRPVQAASRATPSAPPGGHWLMPASPDATASRVAAQSG